MTRKRFFKLRQALMTKVMADSKSKGIDVKGYWLYKMPTPNWGTVIPYGEHAGKKLVSYEQAWEVLKPLRDVYGM